jgi:anthranilate/para-aminobenzoate synthase component I
VAPNVDQAEFKHIVERTRDLIAAGDIFQANLAQAFRAQLPQGFDQLQFTASFAPPTPLRSALLSSPRSG